MAYIGFQIIYKLIEGSKLTLNFHFGLNELLQITGYYEASNDLKT